MAWTLNKGMDADDYSSPPTPRRVLTAWALGVGRSPRFHVSRDWRDAVRRGGIARDAQHRSHDSGRSMADGGRRTADSRGWGAATSVRATAPPWAIWAIWATVEGSRHCLPTPAAWLSATRTRRALQADAALLFLGCANLHG
jgi:hypothetical protein